MFNFITDKPGEEDFFSLKLRHGGQIKKDETSIYVRGKIDWFDYMHIDEWGFITLKEKVEELGYKNVGVQMYSVYGDGLRELVNDGDTWALVSQIQNLRELEVLVVDHSQICEDDNEGSEMDADYEENIDVQLEDIYDSEYDMPEKNEDDKDFENFIDNNVEYVGVGSGIGNETNEHAANDNQPSAQPVEKLNIDVDVTLSDDGSACDYDYGEREYDKWHVFRAKTDMKNPTFCLGLTFATKAEFREAIQNYALNNGKDLKYQRNEKDRVVVNCKYASCPWVINLRKVSQSMSWRILKIVDRHEGCGWEYYNSMVNSSKMANRWVKEIRGHSDWKTYEFRDKVQTDDNVHFTKRQAYREMVKAKSKIQGEAEDDFNKI